jgi:hypothetical protein
MVETVGKRRLRRWKASLFISFLLIGMTSGMVLLGQFQEVIMHDSRSWTVRAENNPGAGMTGFLTMVFIPHNATLATFGNGSTRWNKTFDGTWTNYSYSNALNGAATKTIPYSTKFDIYFKVRVNTSDGQNTSSKFWNFA